MSEQLAISQALATRPCPGLSAIPKLELRTSVRILVVEDHELLRKGLCRLIRSDSGWKVCGEARNGREAVEKGLALHPDLVLMDFYMPIMDGIEATRQIRRFCPRIKIVMMSIYDSQQSAARAAGVNAYVGKIQGWARLRDAIAAVLTTAT